MNEAIWGTFDPRNTDRLIRSMEVLDWGTFDGWMQ
jgi:hypothetical protein